MLYESDVLARRIDEGLVQDDSPFLGSKQFGITYVTGRGAVAEIGTLMEIVDFAPIGSEGRLFINNKGTLRQSFAKSNAPVPTSLQHHCSWSLGPKSIGCCHHLLHVVISVYKTLQLVLSGSARRHRAPKSRPLLAQA